MDELHFPSRQIQLLVFYLQHLPSSISLRSLQQALFFLSFGPLYPLGLTVIISLYRQLTIRRSSSILFVSEAFSSLLAGILSFFKMKLATVLFTAALGLAPTLAQDLIDGKFKRITSQTDVTDTE